MHRRMPVVLRRPAGCADGLSATQRLAIYMVISKPKRISVAAGRSHFIVDLLLCCGRFAVRTARTGISQRETSQRGTSHRGRASGAANVRDFPVCATRRPGAWSAS